ncbi:hypothetical protein CHELA41_51058 [Hyphomicrobiales bacterium]|nr:hypothetical protein CHELA41_51058 [Hyphomicrobiales bacterium]
MRRALPSTALPQRTQEPFTRSIATKGYPHAQDVHFRRLVRSHDCPRERGNHYVTCARPALRLRPHRAAEGTALLRKTRE